ncbi:MAG: hypothetical protein GF329_11275 [Candidatus Lokiarchaeota archaeon]|nr:hypothetical protein [Candidatus Lokiarchaeota archaeon]
MSEEYEFSEESLRKIAEQKVNFRMSVKIHLFVFMVVNALLFIINYIFSPNFPNMPSFWWAPIPLFGWLAGLMIHIVAYIMYSKGVYPMAKRGLIYNTVAYIFVMILLLVINYTTLNTINWSIFPGIFWMIGLVIHGVIYFVYFRGGLNKKTGVFKSRKERAIEKEMEKIRRKHKKEND